MMISSLNHSLAPNSSLRFSSRYTSPTTLNEVLPGASISPDGYLDFNIRDVKGIRFMDNNKPLAVFGTDPESKKAILTLQNIEQNASLQAEVDEYSATLSTNSKNSKGMEMNSSLFATQEMTGLDIEQDKKLYGSIRKTPYNPPSFEIKSPSQTTVLKLEADKVTGTENYAGTLLLQEDNYGGALKITPSGTQHIKRQISPPGSVNYYG